MPSSNTVQNNWVIQLPAGFSWNGYNTSAIAPLKPTASLAADFTSDTPLQFLVSGSTTATGELKINLDLSIHNSTGTTWSGFRIDYVDVVAPVPQFGAPHPYYAHFHDGSFNFSNPAFS